jgi:tetratricopeptide (TPR) repeat protein
VAQALKGDYDGARLLLERAASQPEQGSDALAALGFAASLNGKPDVAVDHLRAALDRNTSARRQVLTRLGVLLVSQGRLEEARGYLADAAAANKDDVQAQFFHGVCLEGLGLTPEAINAFELAAQKQGPLAAEALLRIGELQLVQGSPQKAREAVDKAETAGLSSAALFTVRGRIEAAINEDDRARENFQRALKIDPKYAPAHLENGLLYIKKQAIEDGVKELKNYLSLVDPNQAGTRAAEVEAMISHLQQATGAAQPPAATTAGERSQT